MWAGISLPPPPPSQEEDLPRAGVCVNVWCGDCGPSSIIVFGGMPDHVCVMYVCVDYLCAHVYHM